MLSPNPLVTIAIPTYRRLNLLKEAVNSALHQTYSNLEIVIRQDPTPTGLDKDILQWATDLAEKNSKIKYYKNSDNLGLAGNWNALANDAQGDFIIIIGDDDRLLPDCISTLMQGVQKGADVVFSNHYIIDHEGKRILPYDDFTVRFNRKDLKDGFVENAEEVIWKNAISISSSLIKTSFVKKLQFKSDLNTPEIELFLRINQEKSTFYFTSEYLVEYRLHTQSATASGLKVHYLMKYLMVIPVHPINEKHKIKFLQSISSVSVKNLLKENKRKEALKIIFSKYFGSKKILTIKGAVLTSMTLLPLKLVKYIIQLKE